LVAYLGNQQREQMESQTAEARKQPVLKAVATLLACKYYQEAKGCCYYKSKWNTLLIFYL